MKLTIISFGFFYGVPKEASVVIDCRILRNPDHGSNDMAGKTGQDKEISDLVKSYPFYKKLRNYAIDVIVSREAEGKKEFILGIGCQGGKHRSVTLANELVSLWPVNSKVIHRDMLKPRA